MNNEQNNADRLPLDPATRQPRKQREQPGYFPGYRTLSQKKFWDATTRRLVEDRVGNIPPVRFFTAEERPVISAVCERIMPQDDRLPQYRIPVLNFIDERLWKNEINGYRFEDMPDDREAYRLGIQAIELTARAQFGRNFPDLSPLEQDTVLKSIHDGEKLAAHEIWERMSIDRFWHLLVQDCVSVYYAHPWAWDEIGYGGPAYPRAYTRLEGGMPEPWEVDEQRHEWEAPKSSLSDAYEESGAGSGTPAHGQGGTH
ncbi:MAG: gluconate 2-dehydrogenase subunit 3 family protein [Bryobacteraceae bacterium]